MYAHSPFFYYFYNRILCVFLHHVAIKTLSFCAFFLVFSLNYIWASIFNAAHQYLMPTFLQEVWCLNFTLKGITRTIHFIYFHVVLCSFCLHLFARYKILASHFLYTYRPDGLLWFLVSFLINLNPLRPFLNLGPCPRMAH